MSMCAQQKPNNSTKQNLTSFNPKDVFPQWQLVKRNVVTKQSILAVMALVITAAIASKRIRKQIGSGTMLPTTR